MAVYLGQGGRLVVKVQLMPVITVSISQLRYRRWNTGVLARKRGSGRTCLAKMQDGGTKKHRRHADGAWQRRGAERVRHVLSVRMMGSSPGAGSGGMVALEDSIY